MKDTVREHLAPIIPAFEAAGRAISFENGEMSVESYGRPHRVKFLRTMPYPGFPTDSQALFMAVFAFLIVAADQLTKYLVLVNIPLHGQVEFLPGFLGLTYVQNFGAAFSSFQGMQWLFAVIFAVFTVAVFWEYRKKALPFTTFERWCIAAIYGGGLGNMIDRVRFGYVVDMIETQFIDFPVFNVADSFITCGCIALIAHLILFNRDFWKEEKK